MIAGNASNGQDEDRFERERMLTVLRQTDWNIAKSARLLGIARNTLYQRMKAMNIQRPSEGQIHS